LPPVSGSNWGRIESKIVKEKNMGSAFRGGKRGRKVIGRIESTGGSGKSSLSVGKRGMEGNIIEDVSFVWGGGALKKDETWTITKRGERWLKTNTKSSTPHHLKGETIC